KNGATAAPGQGAAVLEQGPTDAVSADPLDDRQPFGYGEGLEPAHTHGAHRFIAEIGDHMGGAEIVAVELLGVGNVQFANETSGADRERLQRVLHLHGHPDGDGLTAYARGNDAHIVLSQLATRSTREACGLDAPRSAEVSRTPLLSRRS